MRGQTWESGIARSWKRPRPSDVVPFLLPPQAIDRQSLAFMGNELAIALDSPVPRGKGSRRHGGIETADRKP
jgi:hypothetical protein